MHPCFCETSLSATGLTAVVAMLSEFSRSWADIVDDVVLFLSFILENSCSQVHILPRSCDMSKI